MNKKLAMACLAITAFSGIASAYGNNNTVDYYNEWGTKIGSSKQR